MGFEKTCDLIQMSWHWVSQPCVNCPEGPDSTDAILCCWDSSDGLLGLIQRKLAVLSSWNELPEWNPIPGNKWIYLPNKEGQWIFYSIGKSIHPLDSYAIPLFPLDLYCWETPDLLLGNQKSWVLMLVLPLLFCLPYLDIRISISYIFFYSTYSTIYNTYVYLYTYVYTYIYTYTHTLKAFWRV